jgi:hypothetical protein
MNLELHCETWVVVVIGVAFVAIAISGYAVEQRWGARLAKWIKHKLGMW